MIDKKISMELGRIHHVAMRTIDARLNSSLTEPLTVPQSRVIIFIDKNSANGIVCQRDIEEAFDLQPSSISLLLRNMEKNGLIVRRTVEGDGRLKSVHLTDYAETLCHQLKNLFTSLDEAFIEGISDEELTIFFDILDRMRRNLECNATTSQL